MWCIKWKPSKAKVRLNPGSLHHVMNCSENQWPFQVLDWGTARTADVLYVKTCCKQIVFFFLSFSLIFKWKRCKHSGKFSTLHIPKKDIINWDLFSRVSSCGDGQNFMTLPVVYSLGGGKWNAVTPFLAPWLGICTKEAAQLPKTYPIQLGLAYLLLVRAPFF